MLFDSALCYILIRIILPLALGTAVFFRQNVFSSVYLLLLLIGPLLPKPSVNSVLSGCVGIYINCVIITSLLMSFAHVVFQIVLFTSYPNYEESIDYCSQIGQIYNLIGLHRYDGISVMNVLRLCGMDFMVLFASGVIQILVKKGYNQLLKREREREEIVREQEARRLERERRMTETGLSIISSPANKTMQDKFKKLTKQKASMWAYYITEMIFMVLLCAAAILNPSASSAIYFITFLSISTWLSLNHQTGSLYHLFRLFLTFYLSIQFIILFVYQMEYFRPYLSPDDIKARVFGFVDYIELNCTTIRNLEYQNLHWAIYVHPLILICLYFISTSLIRVTVFKKKHVINVQQSAVDVSISALTSHRPSEVRSDNENLPSSSNWMCANSAKPNDNEKPNKVHSTDFDDGQHQTTIMHLDDLTLNRSDVTPLLSDDRMGRNYHSTERSKINVAHKSGVEIDSNGSIIWKPENEVSNLSSVSGAVSHNPSRPESPGITGPETSKTLMIPLIQLAKLIKRGSYVGTLIVMMAWSITYHSWLSFLFLLWSCVIWMIPNSRRACLKSSPFLVIYALFLLIGQYVYSFNLNENELPESIGSLSMSEIGFKKYYDLSYQPLFIKILYTLMFWLTLRQYQEEKASEHRKRLVQGIAVEPFNIGYGTGQAGAPRRDLRRQMSLATTTGTYQSPLFRWIFDFIKDILIQYWIWMVATMLMVMSLSGDRVVFYRIVYMLLFLAFVLIFQFSFRIWRKLMYPFWLIVIVYSMIILTAIYTYQFNKFPEYWEKYLKINKNLQEDLGLTVYGQDAWILFKELFTPTFFLIITIIQVHFLHKDFLVFSNIEEHLISEPTSSSSPSSSSPNAENLRNTEKADVRLDVDKSLDEDNNSSISPTTVKSNVNQSNDNFSFATPNEEISPKSPKSKVESDVKNKVKNQTSLDEIKDLIAKIWILCKPWLDELIEAVYRLLEIHLIKVILYCAVIISITDISALNFTYIILAIVGMSFTRFETIICHFLGIWTGALILLKMIFQLKVAQDISWFTNCTDNYNNISQVVDNRIYIGFRETNNIYSYIMDYVILILVLTFNSVIIIRQTVARFKKNKKPPPIGIVFPGIIRKDADRNFKGFFMFLVNYGFYKFGNEICITLLIVSIGARIDIFSVFYAIWLFIMVMQPRTTLSKIWPFFVCFMAIVLPFQYALCLGIPPGLCLNYPWGMDVLDKYLRDWLFLPDFKEPPNVNRLYLDFIIFLFACRQLVCFYLEKCNYPGGSNMEAHLESSEIQREYIPDSFTDGSNTFDFVKSHFFFCFFWLTLAIVFLAGTLRVSLFALGYVLGCFIFLWNGNEFYLKPIRLIFKLWNTLIGYACFVILMKSVLQVVGCVYINNLATSFCWVAQLFGIACLKQYRTDISKMVDDVSAVNKCFVNYEEASLLWDGICFAFLIVQRRIFSSYYFYHLIKEVKAQQVLASRGAELIHEIQAKEVADQEQAEKEVMEKIKQKMDRIKAQQQKIFVDKAKSIKYHKQEDDFGYDVSPYYSTADEMLSHTSEPEEPLSHTLPTVYSPTPSLPTVTSPQSAASPQPGYLEVYRVGPLPIDSRASTITFPSISLKSTPTDERYFSPSPYPTHPFPIPESYFYHKTNDLHPDAVSLSRQSSTRTQIPRRSFIAKETLSRSQSLKRKLSTRSVPGSHGSSVKSGGYYMFQDIDSEIVDINEKQRRSLIPDPEGDELRRIAKLRGFTTFCSKLMKGEDLEPEKEPQLFSGEITEVGESSKDSAIVSVDREMPDFDASARTTVTSLPSTSRMYEHPSSSKASSVLIEGDHQVLSEKSDETKKEQTDDQLDEQKLSLFSRFKSLLRIVVMFFESCIISATANLNDLSRDYRYVAKRLEVEKRYLKTIFDIEEKEGNRYDFMDANWKKKTLAKISETAVPKFSKSFDSFDEPIRKKEVKEPKMTAKKSDKPFDSSIYTDADFSYIRSNVFMRFLLSGYYAILSRSEVMCYVVIILNQLSSASVLSLPLPLMAFLWGSLSVPRPSKAFWISAITYTEMIVVIKYIFQFPFWPWVGKLTIADPFYEPKIFGIMQSDQSYAQYDLLLLFVLFFHRFMLKSLGLWDLSDTEIVAFMESVDSERSKLSKKSLDPKPTVFEEKKQKYLLKEKQPKSFKSYLEKGDIKQVRMCDDGDNKYEDDQKLEAEDEDFESELEESVDAVYSVMAPSKIKNGILLITKPVVRFFHGVLRPPYRITKDVYTLMFICDFVNFFILVFGFGAFGVGYSNDDVTSFLEENKIPIPFFVTILMQFTLIMIDRALYLRKNIKGKLIFQILLVCGMHIWLFFALPAMTKKSFTESVNWPPRLYYIFKCLYFLLSAFQIRSGYPTRILGNCFCKNYNLLNWYLFKGYMVIPFLYDLRLYMDWIFTETSLVLDEWSLMEDIYVNLFERKCELKLDEEFPEPRGKPKRRFFKYLLGGAWVALIIALLWGPLGLFAFGRAVGSPNRPVDVTIEMEFSGYQPIFRMGVTGNPIEKISDSYWSSLKRANEFVNNAEAQTFISGYDQDDVVVVNINSKSTTIWGASPPSKKNLEETLTGNSPIIVKLTYFITRRKLQKSQDLDLTISDVRTIELENSEEDRKLRNSLSRMLSDDEEENKTAILPFIFPNYLRAPEKGKPREVKQFGRAISSVLKDKLPKTVFSEDSYARNNLNFRHVDVLLKKAVNNSNTLWWEVSGVRNSDSTCNETYFMFVDEFMKGLLKDNSCNLLPIVIFNDKVFIGVLAVLSGYGIIGLYTTFVFLVSRWVRGLNSESSFKVIYTRMPNVDRVLQLCLDIYLVRESGEFELEEDLYAKLIFLYRSPETLIKWTKIVEELPSNEQSAKPKPIK